MAKYTMELRKLCDIFTRQEVENWFKSYDLEDFLTPSQIQVLLKHNVWSKEKLAKKIVDHYFMREIGFETPALFKHYAKTTMNEIMEEYLLKIYTKFLEYDPLSSVDYVETFEREINSENENHGNSSNEMQSSSTSIGSSSSNGSSLNVESDTPQTNINKQNILNGSYASNVQASDLENNASTSSTNNDQSSNNGSLDSNGKSKTIEKYTHTMVGDNGVIVTNQYLVREFRELAVSLDLEIINKLNTLFMGIY